MKTDVTLAELVEALEERPELPVFLYEDVFEMPRTIKNISMLEGGRIILQGATLEEEGVFGEIDGNGLLDMIAMHKKVYDTPDDAEVVLLDPETATLHTKLMLDLDITDRIDINAMGN